MESSASFGHSYLGRVRAKTSLHSTVSPNQYHYNSQLTGIREIPSITPSGKDHSLVKIYINSGDHLKKDSFVAFLANRNQIESVFGCQLRWERLDDKRASRIIHQIVPGGFRSDESAWPEIQEQMIDAMIRFEKALRPSLEKLKTRF